MPFPAPLPDPIPFLDRLFACLAKDGVDVSPLPLDHLCYRTESMERYVACKALISHHGTLLAESPVAGRPIATFRLHQGIAYHGRTVELVELASPKAGSPYPEGYEHAEFLVADELEDFLRRHPQASWSSDALHASPAPDIRLRYPGLAVKFRRVSLAEVIAREKALQR
jgi:predicted metalloenzyme YecM